MLIVTKGAAKAYGIPPAAQETAGETAQDFVGSLRQTFKGRDELRQASQRRRAF